MNQQVKEKWVAALRSGEYKQGRAVLRSEHDCMCCLGVLCEIAVAESIVEQPCLGDDGSERVYRYGPEGRNNWPPLKVLQWAGLSEDDAEEVEIAGMMEPLWRHNDSFKRTFAEIADAIEAQL